MADLPPTWLEAIASPDVTTFDRALIDLRGTRLRTAEELVRLVQVIASGLVSATLPQRERDRRLRLAIERLQPSPEMLTLIAHAAPSLPRQCLNAVRAVLPPELRGLAVVPPERAVAPVPGGGLPESAELETQPPVTMVPPTTGAPDTEAQYAVALVGVATEHDNNRSMLAAADLKPLPVRTIDELINVAPTGICGFVIGSSVWTAMSAAEQERLLGVACGLSTVLFARVAVDGLSQSIAQRFPEIIARTRCGPLDATRFCHGGGCQLTPADICVLRRTACMLAEAEETVFFPLGMEEAEGRLLRLIAAVRAAKAGGNEGPRQLAARELPGGRSGARVYLVQTSEHHRPLVIKLDDVERLRRELAGYHTWISQWETAVTDPQLHTHLGTSAISYRLQADADAPHAPAPTLEDGLLALRTAELWDHGRVTSQEDRLVTVIRRAASQLAMLNGQRVASTDAGDDFWLHWSTQSLQKLGVETAIVLPSGASITAAGIAAAAYARVARMHKAAVTHGDVHGRNILMMDHSPVFIDFALSGPGHPCYDLVRLDAAVRMHAMRFVLSEADMAAFYEQLYLDRPSAADLQSRFPAVSRSPSARVAIATAIDIRERSLRILDTFGGGLQDYVSMVAIVSAYLLAERAPTSGVERAVLAGVARAII